MSTYKKIISAWLNESKNKPGEKYLSIKNVSEEPITIEPGTSLNLNMTPASVRDEHPGVPLFSKSVKVEETEIQEYTSEGVADDVPF